MKKTLSYILLRILLSAALFLITIFGIGCDTVSRVEMRVVKSDSASDFSVSVTESSEGVPVPGVDVDVRVVHPDHCPQLYSTYGPDTLNLCLKTFTPINENFERQFPGYSILIKSLATNKEGLAGTVVGMPKDKYFLLLRVRHGSRSFYTYFLLDRNAPTLIISLPPQGGTQNTWIPPSK